MVKKRSQKKTSKGPYHKANKPTKARNKDREISDAFSKNCDPSQTEESGSGAGTSYEKNSEQKSSKPSSNDNSSRSINKNQEKIQDDTKLDIDDTNGCSPQQERVHTKMLVKNVEPTQLLSEEAKKINLEYEDSSKKAPKSLNEDNLHSQPGVRFSDLETGEFSVSIEKADLSALELASLNIELMKMNYCFISDKFIGQSQNKINRFLVKMSTAPDKEVPAGFKILNEGQAWILYHQKDSKRQKTTELEEEKVPQEEEKKAPKKLQKMNRTEKNETRDTVFYNPVQEFNRDLSILCITEYGSQLQQRREQKD